MHLGREAVFVSAYGYSGIKLEIFLKSGAKSYWFICKTLKLGLESRSLSYLFQRVTDYNTELHAVKHWIPRMISTENY